MRLLLLKLVLKVLWLGPRNVISPNVSVRVLKLIVCAREVRFVALNLANESLPPTLGSMLVYWH